LSSRVGEFLPSRPSREHSPLWALWRVFFTIVLPLSRPSLGAVGVFPFIAKAASIA
jgi:hypothetical protein